MVTNSQELLFICSPRLNQLRVLSLLADNPHITQAALARRCGLSVSMVNNYMKELSEAGLIEYRRKSTKSVSYHITSSGRAEVDMMESELTGDAIVRFAQAKERLRNRILSQSRGATLRRVALYGTGHLAEMVFLALAQTDVSVIGVCDDNPTRGRNWCGCAVFDPTQLAALSPDAVIITDWWRTDEIWNRLQAHLKSGIVLIRLDTQPSSGDSVGDVKHARRGSKTSAA